MGTATATTRRNSRASNVSNVAPTVHTVEAPKFDASRFSVYQPVRGRQSTLDNSKMIVRIGKGGVITMTSQVLSRLAMAKGEKPERVVVARNDATKVATIAIANAANFGANAGQKVKYHSDGHGTIIIKKFAEDSNFSLGTFETKLDNGWVLVK